MRKRTALEKICTEYSAWCARPSPISRSFNLLAPGFLGPSLFPDVVLGPLEEGLGAWHLKHELANAITSKRNDGVTAQLPSDRTPLRNFSSGRMTACVGGMTPSCLIRLRPIDSPPFCRPRRDRHHALHGYDELAPQSPSHASPTFAICSSSQPR